jgi:glutathione synthase/RimK-type ligase-like ATP-grasp enzyme
MDIGILLNPKAKHEQLPFYEEATSAFGLTPVLLTFKEVEQRTRLPAVIHNRTYARTTRDRQLLFDLSKQSYVYNGGNRFSKLYIHKTLMHNVYLRPNLPGTTFASASTLQAWMKKYASLILKPDRGSVGRGIMLLHKVGGQWHWTHNFETTPFRKLPTQLMQILSKRPYIVQQRLPLATYNGQTFDVRVSVQRSPIGVWQVTGMVGKVAGFNQIVTNVARGGRAVRVEELIGEAHRNALSQFALAVALQLSLYLPNLADIGLDLGVTQDGFPLFIECNFRDLRYSFGEVGLIDTWKSSYFNPIGYGKLIIKKLHE